MLVEELEKCINGTPLEDAYRKLFNGKLENVVKCDNIIFESIKDENFCSINLAIEGFNNIEESLRSFVASEHLNGLD